jgi:hypothetical protein
MDQKMKSETPSGNRSRRRILVVVLLVASGLVSATSVLYLQPYRYTTRTSMISNQTVAPKSVRVISEWDALKIAFGSNRTFTTLPPEYLGGQPSGNVTATLSLYRFFRSADGKSGGYNMSVILVDNQTGLPKQELLEPPGGIQPSGECVKYMYLWVVETYPVPGPHDNGHYIDAVTGEQIGNPRVISYNLSCGTTTTKP